MQAVLKRLVPSVLILNHFHEVAIGCDVCLVEHTAEKGRAKGQEVLVHRVTRHGLGLREMVSELAG